MASLKQGVKKKLLARSERVKCLDVHPREPWMLCSLYSGQVHLWDYGAQTLVKSFDIVDQLPVRTVKFIVRMSWFICGADDMCCRVYNFNTMEKVKAFEAHQDFIRCLAVHDQLPYVLTSSDDMTIKLWDWSKGWQNTMVFEGHTHYVMSVVFNPKDPNTFATASLDRTIKVWNLTSTVPNFTLEGHEKGVNCVEYYRGGDKPYLISGSDDRTARVWDYQTKCCIQTLAAHNHNISCVMFHPDLPLLITGSEDETVKIWQMATYRLETSLDYGLERVWAVACPPGTNKLAIGCDKGTVVVKLGKDRFVFSMDGNGKIIIAQNSEIQQMNVKTAMEEIVDGEKILLPTKELGHSENIPRKLEHNPNGQFIAVVSEGEYVINTALAWRPKTFGSCLQFAWSHESGGYAILETSQVVKIYKNFKEKKSFKLAVAADNLFGGPLLCVKAGDTVYFYDWDSQERGPIRKIAAAPKNVHWNETGELCCLVCDGSFFVLRFHRDAAQGALDAGGPLPEDGVEDAFDLVDEIDERVRQGAWIGDCFLFTNRNQRLNYYIGGEVVTLAVLERRMYLLGYVPKENRVFLCDKERTIVSYQLHLSVIEYQTAIVRGDLEGAQAVILPRVPEAQRSKIARFLDAQGHKEIALEVSTDDEHRFELAVQLKRLDVAQEIAERANNLAKWKQLGDLATQYCKFGQAAKALTAGQDYTGLLLLYSSTNDRAGLTELAAVAEAKGKHNVAFMARYLTGDLSGCLDILTASQRVPQAAVFARSYCPSLATKAVGQWRKDLGAATKTAASIADPAEYPNLFPQIQAHLPEAKAEKPEAVAEAEAEDEDEGAEDSEAPVSPPPVASPPSSPAAAAPQPPSPAAAEPPASPAAVEVAADPPAPKPDDEGPETVTSPPSTPAAEGAPPSPAAPEAVAAPASPSTSPPSPPKAESPAPPPAPAKDAEADELDALLEANGGAAEAATTTAPTEGDGDADAWNEEVDDNWDP